MRRPILSKMLMCPSEAIPAIRATTAMYTQMSLWNTLRSTLACGDATKRTAPRTTELMKIEAPSRAPNTTVAVAKALSTNSGGCGEGRQQAAARIALYLESRPGR